MTWLSSRDCPAIMNAITILGWAALIRYRPNALHVEGKDCRWFAWICIGANAAYLTGKL